MYGISHVQSLQLSALDSFSTIYYFEGFFIQIIDPIQLNNFLTDFNFL